MKYESGHIKEIAGYRLALRLGSGGMGDVYKAYNAALNRTAAIKILHQQEMADRFRNEAYIQSSVSHPNIASLYEYLVSGDTACIIMEYVDGDSLDVYLHRKGKLSSDETEQIVKQIASALDYLHGKDIFHRDIKPQNFKIDAHGKVTMLDFGIAKNKYTPKLTQQGYIVGTTEYMAPEQFQEKVDKKSDVWSLGVLTYELLTGYMPFDANNPVTMRAKIEKGDYTKPNILVPQVSEKLSLIIQKSLQVNPSNRISAAQIVALYTDKKEPAREKKKIKFPVQFKKQWKRPVKINKEKLSSFEATDKVKSVFKRKGQIVWPSFINKKSLGIAATAVGFGLIVLVLANSINTRPDEKKTDEPKEQVRTLTINVSNTSKAYIVFPDGSSEKLPYDISGKTGQNFQFRIQADGYISKEVEVPISVGRKSYDYNLEKIKE